MNGFDIDSGTSIVDSKSGKASTPNTAHRGLNPFAGDVRARDMIPVLEKRIVASSRSCGSTDQDSKRSLVPRNKVVKAREVEPSDESLISDITKQKRDALARLYGRYAAVLMGVAYRILQNRVDAEDLLHDVFLEVWNKAGNYDRARGKVKAWLVLLTRSRAIDRKRVLIIARRHAMVAEQVDDAEAPELRPDVLADQALVRAAVTRLDDRQREILQLSYFQGLSCREIAERGDTPLGTVKSRLRAAVHTLQAEFNRGEEFGDVD